MEFESLRHNYTEFIALLHHYVRNRMKAQGSGIITSERFLRFMLYFDVISISRIMSLCFILHYSILNDIDDSVDDDDANDDCDYDGDGVGGGGDGGYRVDDCDDEQHHRRHPLHRHHHHRHHHHHI